MRTCRKGHQYHGDENYRARSGRCPECLRDVQRRYENSPKGRARHVNFNHSDKGADRYSRYNQSPKGWLNALKARRQSALKVRAMRNQRKEAEDSRG